MPFGVELPENLGSSPDSHGSGESSGGGVATPSAAPQSGAPTGAAPQVSTSPQGTQTQNGTTGNNNLPTLADLDKLERFVFKGREWTRKELEDGHLRQSDYTRKMQEVAETRKYADNFAFDLRTVMADRNKLADFEKIYPKAYVDRAKEILAQLPGHNPQDAQPSKNLLKDDPDFQNMKSEFSEWKQAQREAEITKIQSWIDNQFERLSKKYPHAIAEVVNNRAWAASNQNQKIDESALEKLFQTNDQEMKKRMDEMYKGKITQQLKVQKEGKDVGAGGDISGGVPKKFKNIKEATQGILNDLAAR